MTSQDHEVMVLAVQRGGAELVRPRLTSGDHLLLQGSWPALERYLSSTQLLVIDSPDQVRTQAVVLGRGAKRVFAILALLVALLVFNITPAPIRARAGVSGETHRHAAPATRLPTRGTTSSSSRATSATGASPSRERN